MDYQFVGQSKKTIKNLITKTLFFIQYLLARFPWFENPELHRIAYTFISFRISIERHHIGCIAHECSEHYSDTECLTSNFFLKFSNLKFDVTANIIYLCWKYNPKVCTDTAIVPCSVRHLDDHCVFIGHRNCI